MVLVGWQRHDFREILGPLARIVAAAVLSSIWGPVGNTGGANASATKPMEVPADLQALLNEPGN
jgi:hypothetical protein